MRAPTPSEPKSTFPTYQVPLLSAMRGSAPRVQVARAAWGGRADPPSDPRAPTGASSVITGSSCCLNGNSNVRMQSVTENCLLNYVTVPKIQRNDPNAVAHNNSYKLDNSKFGALSLGRDIPNQKSDDLEVLDLNALNDLTTSARCSDHRDHHTVLQRTQEEYRYAAPLRLRGGGESSLSTGTSGWGTPPSQQASNNNANNSTGWGSANPANQTTTGTQQWNNANRPPTSNQGPTSQDANKANSNINANGQQPPTSQSTAGWGPGANKPPSANMPTSSSSTNSQNNNGQLTTTNSTTKQLEQLNNMREAIFSQDGWGGQHVNQDTNWDIPGSPEPSGKMEGTGPAPWKPAVNNGTELWEANLRNGGQPPPQPQQKTPWGHTPSTNIGGTWGEDDETDSSNVWTGVPSGQQQWGANSGNGATMWATTKKETEWGGGSSAGGWGDPRAADPRAGSMEPRDMRPDLRDMRPGANETIRLLDPREQMRIAGSDMRGDPRGITGRLNGAGAEAFWGGQSAPHAGAQHMHHQNKMPVGPGNLPGWEEPSPPSQRRNVPNYDDGTSLWGNPQQGSHWKDLPTGASMGRGANATGGPPGMAQSRIKPEANAWNHGRNGSWDEPATQGWDEAGPWPKQKMPVAGPLWEPEGEWGHKLAAKQQQFTKEMVWNSKQFRYLVDMGFKKEEVENALRQREMNIEEALELLSPCRNQDGWRNRQDEHYEHSQFPGQRFPQAGPSGQMSFPPGSNAPMLNNMNSSTAANNSLINNISPAIAQVQKMLQGGNSQGFGGATAGAVRNLQPQAQPSTQQLRMLVQQIQMAVQAGYLNHQILNQPLAPQTLVLLNQLLQQIKALQQLINQQTIAQAQCINGKPNSTVLQCSVFITKTKQQITNLQNQINAQQALYVKQQQGGLPTPPDFLKGAGMHDSINTLQASFDHLGLKESAQVNQQQSRLNQWINKDKEEGGDFSRAPGSTSKPQATSPNINPLGLTQPDGPWSNGRSGDTGWPESGGNDVSNDVKDAQWPTTAQPSLTDLVPEFEPGKPWKGTQIKSIEDDPSITPGSVVRSPLSIATIKDTELFNMNPSKSPPPGEVGPMSLSSSTWSFNPPSSTSSAFTSPQNKLPTSKGGLSDLNPSTAVTSELWTTKSRGPPPGLSGKGWNIGGVEPWSSGGNQQRTASTAGGNWFGGKSQWLLLRNLTAQIDGSTLRTLCMQHGPLLSFHLYLHQCFALARYSSREEAVKAQAALNNCVLGNTTILAENPTDWEAQSLLQQVANQQHGGSSGAWRSTGKQPGSGGDTWSTGWSNNNPTGTLWGTSGLDVADPARATPSSLNSFLPGDLLGGESI